jgi:hypothetical protein
MREMKSAERHVQELVRVEALMDKAGRNWKFNSQPSYKTPLMWEPVLVWNPMKGYHGAYDYYETVEQYLEAQS